MQIANSITGFYRPAALTVRPQETVSGSKTSDAISAAASTDANSTKPAAPVSFRDSARQKLDADYAKAKAAGTTVVMDTTYGGRHLDVSGLSDRELAAVVKGQGFTKDESLTAHAELAGRMATALNPFAGSPGDHARAVKAMYPALPQDVKDALGWNEAMLEMGDRIINADQKPADEKGKMKSLFDRLLEGQNDPKALRIDTSLIEVKGGSVNLTA